MTTYQPTIEDELWVRNLISKLRDGGTWAIPRTGDAYVVDKVAQCLTRTVLGWAGDELHERNRVVWAAIGWTVEDSFEVVYQITSRERPLNYPSVKGKTKGDE